MQITFNPFEVFAEHFVQNKMILNFYDCTADANLKKVWYWHRKQPCILANKLGHWHNVYIIQN